MKLRNLDAVFVLGICRDCRPILDDLEKTPIRIPQTPSIEEISMSIGNINLVSVVDLLACTHCFLAGKGAIVERKQAYYI